MWPGLDFTVTGFNNKLILDSERAATGIFRFSVMAYQYYWRDMALHFWQIWINTPVFGKRRACILNRLYRL